MTIHQTGKHWMVHWFKEPPTPPHEFILPCFTSESARLNYFAGIQSTQAAFSSRLDPLYFRSKHKHLESSSHASIRCFIATYHTTVGKRSKRCVWRQALNVNMLQKWNVCTCGSLPDLTGHSFIRQAQDQVDIWIKVLDQTGGIGTKIHTFICWWKDLIGCRRAARHAGVENLTAYYSGMKMESGYAADDKTPAKLTAIRQHSCLVYTSTSLLMTVKCDDYDFINGALDSLHV